MLNSENIQHNMGVLNSNFECSANDNAQVLDPLIPNLQIGWDPPDKSINLIQAKLMISPP